MKITNKLPRFNIKKGLFIVTGKIEAQFHLAKEGEINEIDSIKIEKPKYSDREGYFESGGKNSGGELENYKSGSVYEDKNEVIKRELISELKEKLKSIIKKYEFDSIYLFSPDYMIGDIKKSLNKNILSKIEKSYTGNFNKMHPFKLLEKIDEEIENKIKDQRGKPRSEEERKILKKSGMDNIYDE